MRDVTLVHEDVEEEPEDRNSTRGAHFTSRKSTARERSRH